MPFHTPWKSIAILSVAVVLFPPDTINFYPNQTPSTTTSRIGPVLMTQMMTNITTNQQITFYQDPEDDDIVDINRITVYYRGLTDVRTRYSRPFGDPGHDDRDRLGDPGRRTGIIQAF